jgi:hypothetical protein
VRRSRHRLVLLKFDDGTFEAAPWPATRFKLPRYLGRTRAELRALLLPAKP